MDPDKAIEEAKRLLAEGKDKKAAQLLTDAAYRTHDPELERKIRELATEGRDRAGFFGKGRWNEIIRVAELRSQAA
ncbi:MAG: hypothetical protein U0R69_16745 [Gaiellales bacterium]